MSLFAEARSAAREAAIIIVAEAENDVAVIRAEDTRLAKAVDALQNLRITKDDKIEVLKAKVKSEQETLSSMDSLPGALHELKELKRREAELRERLAEVAVDIQTGQREITQLEREKVKLLRDLDELSKPTDDGMRHVLDLYRATTRVQWNLDTEPHVVAGCVVEPDHVVPFEMSSNKNSRFYIVNQIWGQMTAQC